MTPLVTHMGVMMNQSKYPMVVPNYWPITILFQLLGSYMLTTDKTHIVWHPYYDTQKMQFLAYVNTEYTRTRCNCSILNQYCAECLHESNNSVNNYC